jgi:fatty acid desaturase
MRHAEYVRVLRPLLPKEAFAPAPLRAVEIVVHLAVVFGVMALALSDGRVWVQLALAPISGHSMGVLFFLGHELSHGAMIRSARRRYPLEVLCWAVIYTPATMWRHIHERHHRHTQTPDDCDRIPIDTEWNAALAAYSMSYPHRRNPRWNPLTYTQYTLYVLGNLFVCLRYGVDPRRPASPYVFAFTGREYLRLWLECLPILGLRLAVYFGGGASVRSLLLVDFLPFVLGMGMVYLYGATNHGARPLSRYTDPVLGSMSLIMPRAVDRVHAFFSYHTEHHVFPSMDARWLPEVARLLETHFPDRYRRVSPAEAWRELFEREPFMSTGGLGPETPEAAASD